MEKKKKAKLVPTEAVLLARAQKILDRFGHVRVIADRKFEVKQITIKVRSRLSNATLRIYADEAARLIVEWARLGNTPTLPGIVADVEATLVTKRAKVEGVGKR